MVRGVNESMIELQLKEANYLRTDNNDGSNDNTMEIGKIEGWTLLPNATYPQLIAPFEEESKTSKMVRIHWYMLEAVAGIPVTERFEVNIIPLRIQLEYETWTKFFEYIFPGISSGKSESVEFSPFMIKHMLPTHQEEDEDDTTQGLTLSTSHPGHQHANDEQADNLAGVGDLELRLQPTLTLPDARGPKSPRKSNNSRQNSHSDLRRLRHFTHSDGNELRKQVMRRKDPSSDSISGFSRGLSHRSNTNMSELSAKGSETPKRFALLRTNTSASMSKKQARSNDLTEMLNRASKYMTLSYVNIESMVLCLSYKGKGNRNLVTDVHDLVFRLPTLEYRNKTWSSLDLVMHLKKEVIRALVSHSGAIIGNKFSNHRYSKLQQSRLREMANSSIVLGANSLNDPSRAGSESASASTRRLSILDDDDSSAFPRSSFASGRGSTLSRDDGSISSDTHSGNYSNGNGNGAHESSSERPRTASSAIGRHVHRPASSHSLTPYATPSPSGGRPSSLRRLTGSFSNVGKERLGSRQGTPEVEGREEDGKDR
jgi:hypothetical protein